MVHSYWRKLPASASATESDMPPDEPLELGLPVVQVPVVQVPVVLEQL